MGSESDQPSLRDARHWSQSQQPIVLVVCVLILLFVALSLAAQDRQPPPVFSLATVVSPAKPNSKLFAAGMILTVYGTDLQPRASCASQNTPPAPYPVEICGVRVLLDSAPSELLFTSSNQINLKLPANSPDEGSAALRVCVVNVCSAPVTLQFSTRRALLALERPAYVHMPVWIAVDAPSPYSVAYPCSAWPWSFSGYEFEVRHNDQLLRQLPTPVNPREISTSGKACVGPTLRSSLPLHLLYRFDEPGEYSVRLTAMNGTQIIYQTDWTNIQVGSFSDENRAEHLRALEARANLRSADDDVVPSLLAWPDEKALAVLLKVIPEGPGCVNYDCVRAAAGRAGLAGFDPLLLRREIPDERLRRLCPPDGNCK